MKNYLFAICACAVVFTTHAATVGTVLSCTGKTHKFFDGDFPHDQFHEESKYSSEGDTVLLSDDKSWAHPLFLFKEKLNLCRSSETEYIYSSHCSVVDVSHLYMDGASYIHEWTSMLPDVTPRQAEAKMFKRYGSKGLQVETLTVNRIDLSITDTLISPEARGANEARLLGMKLKNEDNVFWVQVTNYHGTCTLKKQKI